MRLTSKEEWAERWEGQDLNLGINVTAPIFREKHKLFNKFIPRSDGGSMVEIGAYPGSYLQYFYENFGFTPWGVEYAESCSEQASKKLSEAGVPVHMLCKDFFELQAEDSPAEQGWDLTVSFGFVEHFENTLKVVKRHIAVTKPGGYIVIAIPNHFGLNGSLLKIVDYGKWRQHNLMSLESLKDNVRECQNVEMLFGGYVGRLGFWNVGFYSWIKNSFPRMYPFIRGPLWLVENAAQWLIPNNRWTSPDALVILKRTE